MDYKNYVFILGPHKSGSSLLRSLLNGHPELFVIPIETQYFSISKRFWVNYFLWAERPRTKISDPQHFIQFIDSYVHSTSQYRDVERPDFINVDQFKQYVLANWPVGANTKEEINVYFDALHYSIFGKLPEKSRIVVEKSVANAENAVRFKKLFPNAKFIHLLRNPYENLVSFRNYRLKSSGQFPSLRDLVESLKVNYYYMYKNQEIIDDYLVLKYEDLVSDTEKAMRAVASIIGVSFDPILTKPTVLDNIWQGNSSQGRKFDGISRERANTVDKGITRIEVKLIDRLFDFVLDDYSYAHVQMNRSFFSFGKSEKLKTYIYNRLYYYFS